MAEGFLEALAGGTLLRKLGFEFLSGGGVGHLVTMLADRAPA